MGSKLIIVPFADFAPEQQRAKQLKQFIAHMTPLIKGTNFEIVIAEQITPFKYFNRGQLLNAGLKWYIETTAAPQFIITHDVDMLPDKPLFAEYKKANNLISLVPQDAEYKKKYGRVILGPGGGIFGLPYSDFVEANGYPNDFWTWGAEDDAFSKRLNQIGKDKFSRVRNGHIKHIDVQRQSHQTKMDYLRKNKIRSMMAYENMAQDAINWQQNGYNQVPIDVAEVIEINPQIHHIKLILDETNLAESIAHNERIYKELGY
jgi:hypothetical protein